MARCGQTVRPGKDGRDARHDRRGIDRVFEFYAEAGKHRRRIVGAMCEQVLLHPNITVVSQSHESFSQGFRLYRRREDKGYSLTGCISMSVCRKREIHEVLTNDNHFKQEGLTILF